MSVQTDHQSAVEETEDERAQAGVTELAVRARTAARSLRSATTATKDAALHGIADALVAAAAEITAANAIDVQRESDGGMSPGLVDRLRLDETRIAGIDRKSTRLNSSHVANSYAVFCLKNKKTKHGK